jgi:predicted dehydrogenase
LFKICHSFIARLARPGPISYDPVHESARFSHRRGRSGPGFGCFAGGAHSHAVEKWRRLKESSDYELVGIWEEDPRVRKTFEALGARLLSRDELFRHADAVAVESAVRDHARHAELALRANKHVHVEKPPSANHRELARLIQLARAGNRVFQVGYMWRYNPAFKAIFAANRAGVFGRIFQVRAAMTTLLPAERRWEWFEFAGGAMFEQGSHLLDPIVRLLGKPTAILPVLRRHGEVADELKDNNAVVLEYPRALAVLTNSSLQPNGGEYRSFEVLGSNGTAVVRPIEPPILEIDLVKGAGQFRAGRQQVPMPRYERYVGDFAELAQAIRGESTLSVTFAEELAVHETVLRASEMASSRRR